MGLFEGFATLSPYYKESLNNDCLYVYVLYRFGWGRHSPKMITFLYNTYTHKLNYSIMEVGFETNPIGEYLSNHIEKGFVIIKDNHWVDDLFNCKPQCLMDVYDVDNYTILLKNVEKERWLFILNGHQKFYKPFEPIFEIVKSCVFGMI